SHVESFPETISQIFDLYCAVFEFVAGGILLFEQEPPVLYYSLIAEHAPGLIDELSEYMLNFARNTLNRPGQDNLRREPLPFPERSLRPFPQADKLTGNLVWPLKAHGQVLGLLAMGSTAPLKFDQNGQEVLSNFLNHAALVLDNALLVKRQNELNLELKNALFNLQETQAQLVQTEKLASLGQLTAGLVHEMNNPLNFMSGNMVHFREYSQKMLDFIGSCRRQWGGEWPEPLRKAAVDSEMDYIADDLPGLMKDCEEGLRRARRIIDDLRTFSARDRGDMLPTELSAVIESTINILRHLWEGQIELNFEHSDPFEVTCNSGQIGQVVLNLLSNAILAVKAGGGEKSVDVKLSKVENWAQLIVRDTGGGISEDNIGKLFQPFFTTREVGQGMGLGLSITHGIIQRHSGTIEVESQPGNGAVFTIRLPLRQPTKDIQTAGE
ncbi:MAG: ATP-binding protein, partial [Calditrichota bacterium]